MNHPHILICLSSNCHCPLPNALFLCPSSLPPAGCSCSCPCFYYVIILHGHPIKYFRCHLVVRPFARTFEIYANITVWIFLAFIKLLLLTIRHEWLLENLQILPWEPRGTYLFIRETVCQEGLRCFGEKSYLWSIVSELFLTRKEIIELCFFVEINGKVLGHRFEIRDNRRHGQLEDTWFGSFTIDIALFLHFCCKPLRKSFSGIWVVGQCPDYIGWLVWTELVITIGKDVTEDLPLARGELALMS